MVADDVAMSTLPACRLSNWAGTGDAHVRLPDTSDFSAATVGVVSCTVPGLRVTVGVTGMDVARAGPVPAPEVATTEMLEYELELSPVRA
jgi:hypothetical protein